MLTERLHRLNETQESIQTLSYWITFHKRHCLSSVKLWYHEFQQAPSSKKLTLLYLANDIMQHNKKKGGEFIEEFGKIITVAVLATYQMGNETIQNSVGRLLQIWLDRKIFSVETIESMKNQLGMKRASEINPKVKDHPIIYKWFENLEKLEEEIHNIRPHVETISEKLRHGTPLISKNPKERQGIEEVDALLHLLYDYESKLKLKQEQRRSLCNYLLEEYQKQQKLTEEDVHILQRHQELLNQIMNMKETSRWVDTYEPLLVDKDSYIPED